jgi:hypothetical protein
LEELVVGQGLVGQLQRQMRGRSRLLCAAVGAALLVQMAGGPPVLAQAGPGPVAPLSDLQPSVYWGAFVQGWPDDPKAIDNLQQLTGKAPSIVAWGQAWWRRGAYSSFPSTYAEAVRNRGSIPLVSWVSWDACCGVDQPVFQLASIIRGDHDAYLMDYARSAARWGHPFFVDFDSEMNGWWWPWSEQVNGNNPGEFVAAWRHVHDIFVRQGATNATWVWCPNIVEPKATPLEQLYPGDNYVDWVCMDGYNWGSVRGKWQDPAQVFGPSDYRGESSAFNSNTYDLLQQLAPNKPIMIGETSAPESAPDGSLGNKADWITDAYTQALPNQFPAVKAMIWYGWFDRTINTNWAIDTSPESATAFADAIALPRYASNAYKNLAKSPIQPPDSPFTGTNNEGT